MSRIRSPETEIRYLRRDLRNACKLLDMAAADDGRPIRPSCLRERSSSYARAAHDLMPKRRGRA